MDRVIKFRAWDKKDKVMLLWHESPEWIKDAIPFDMGDEWTEQCQLMQFTGLLDKQGREIYEGDVVKLAAHYEGDFRYPEHACKVVFDEGCFCLINKKNEWFDLSQHILNTEVEIIGNIHANPELIERKPMVYETIITVGPINTIDMRIENTLPTFDTANHAEIILPYELRSKQIKIRIEEIIEEERC